MSSITRNKPVVLAVAGFDPSGGAGIIADIRTIESFGCTAVGTVTSVTFQNAKQFFGAIHQSPESVRAQIEAIVANVRVAAVKIGMVPTPEIVREVARLIRDLKLPASVIDPVIESTTGAELMSDEAFEVFVTNLLPLARVLTPNIPEAEKLSGMNITDEHQMRQAAARIRELGARAVLVKGGHLNRWSVVSGQGTEANNREAVDLLDDGGHVAVFRSEWIEAPNIRGTGCKLTSAIAASLANGSDLKEAVGAAKAFVADMIRANLGIEN